MIWRRGNRNFCMEIPVTVQLCSIGLCIYFLSYCGSYFLVDLSSKASNFLGKIQSCGPKLSGQPGDMVMPLIHLLYSWPLMLKIRNSYKVESMIAENMHADHTYIEVNFEKFSFY
jgi:hypothetical protein